MAQNPDKFISAAKIKETFSVSNGTLNGWANAGRVNCRRMPGGKRLFSERDIHRMFGEPETECAANDEGPNLIEKQNICYARVSSQHQKHDLKRQIEFLQTAYPDYIIIQDIGSGLNFRRKGFVSLLDRVHAGTVASVVVQHRDRLCRYGVELVEWLFRKTGTKLVVHGELPSAATSSSSDGECNEPSGGGQRDEFADDIISIVTYFVAKHNGRRSTENRRQRIRLGESAAPIVHAQAEHARSTASKQAQATGRKRKAAADDEAAACEETATKRSGPANDH